ncbi:phage tail protein [Lactiplantibacillus plantarum]|uniref:phage tail protein n=1 Tax=Lactiplantibacillus plantarum TaxID=1590 RepID=UPI00237E1FBD|nr:phage tail protein [Lactiplantibacillus plantarum]WDT52073.1 phage tail protein [Lactiplantibacillus plantarum]
MARSAFVEVNITNSTKLAQDSQNTADNAVKGVTDLNDPNLMSVIEKQNNVAQFAGLTSQYNVIVQNAKDEGIDTTAVTTAYNNLNKFMADVLAEPDHASDVNRDTYKGLIDAYNTALSNVQTALSNSFNTDIDNMQSSVSVASQAASSAVIVASQATVTGNSASQVASQAVVVASQAQIAGNNATSVANSASQAASSAVLAGSTAAVNADKASADYQTLSAGVKNGSVVHITTETAIDKGVIGTAEIANAAITSAQIGSEAVGTAQIANLAVGTAQIGDAAITNAKIGKLAVGTAQIANAAITDAQVGNVSANKLTAGTIDFNTITGKNINASNITTGTLSTDRLNVGKLSALSADLGNVTAGSLKGVNIVAKTFSTPNGSFTTDSNGAITAKNMTLIGGTLSSPTINASTINGSTINGTTFHGGGVINNANNTAKYHPMTITPDGAYKSTYFDNAVALRASVQSGAIIYDYRSMLPDNNGKYAYSSTTINGQGMTIDFGHTNAKDSTFNGYRTGSSYISLTPSGGLLLHGSDSNLDFGGHLEDSQFDTGMYMNPYGNIIGKKLSDYWQISKQGPDNTGGGPTARFGIDTGDKGTINFYRPLFVDEIGGFTSSNGHALFIHGDDNGTSGSTGQMIFRKDGRSAQVVSASIYNRTYSGGSNVTVTSYGTLGRITSASKYKLDITKETSISPANRLLSIDMSSWIDKSSAELLADSKTNGNELSEPEINVNRHYGLIAEDLIKAGLDEFVIKGDKGQAEGIEYDRLWITLIPKIRQLSNENIQNKMTISKLESEIKELKQGR